MAKKQTKTEKQPKAAAPTAKGGPEAIIVVKNTKGKPATSASSPATVANLFRVEYALNGDDFKDAYVSAGTFADVLLKFEAAMGDAAYEILSISKISAAAHPVTRFIP